MNTKKRNLVISLMVAMFLGAVEGTVVTTAIPTIVKDLQGFQIISLVFSSYLLASAISTPIYGKLADLYGRKNTLSVGIIIFLVGSFLCGLSQNMLMLIAFRVIQGLGAGAIFTITYTIVGDEFTLEQRPKIQGSLGTVWGIASLLGPFLGGVLINMLSWHWIFFINIPFGILSIVLLQRNIDEVPKGEKQPIDFGGIITLSAAMLVFLNIFLSDAKNGMNHNVFVACSVVVTLVLLYVFYRIERVAQEPIFPFDIFTKSSVLVNLISFIASAMMIGIDVYMPIYLQNVLGFDPKISGLSMAPISISWLMASFILGKCMVKYGGKVVTIASNFIILITTGLLFTLGIHSSLISVLLYGFILGFGFGGVFTTLTIMVQESVGYSKRGSATAANSLLRTLGQTIGVSIFGGIFNLYITKFFIGRGIQGVDPSNLYSATAHNPAVTTELTKLSINNSVHVIFLIFMGMTVLSIILAFIMPNLKQTDAPEVQENILTE